MRLQVASLYTHSKREELWDERMVGLVEEALLKLPKLRLLTCPGLDCDQDQTHSVESVVDVNRPKWRCLYRQGYSVAYRRVLDHTDGV